MGGSELKAEGPLRIILFYYGFTLVKLIELVRCLINSYKHIM